MQADRIYCGDALTVLKTLPDNSVNCCITSPPYYALRDYGVDGQINTVPYKGGHFAAFPPKLAETCLLAGCPPGGVVLDPFLGSGTTAAVAKQLGRHYIGIELNPEYCKLAEKRIGGVAV